ncbi:MAG: hypothetical protein ACLQPD_02775 [Desulfomonilaceae bacterium]
MRKQCTEDFQQTVSIGKDDNKEKGPTNFDYDRLQNAHIAALCGVGALREGPRLASEQRMRRCNKDRGVRHHPSTGHYPAARESATQ